ncbi:MAG: indole-3-glycerol-phosphate synthase TrpC, partial [Deltaproteobacteria bacterium]|nr:indole-3-glycerol-phosphate synthase TrpC [Deltaproteobacteria bacterium]
MSTILDKILGAKRDEVIAAKAARSFAQVDADAKQAGRVRGLTAALTRAPGQP